MIEETCAKISIKLFNVLESGIRNISDDILEDNFDLVIFSIVSTFIATACDFYSYGCEHQSEDERLFIVSEFIKRAFDSAMKAHEIRVLHLANKDPLTKH